MPELDSIRPVAAKEGPAIRVTALTKTFGQTVALVDCSLEIRRGEFLSLLGPSGCGKTTLLRIIGGFLAADQGAVELFGAPADGLPPNKRPVNTVFQGYALFPHKTVFENIAFPLELAKVPKRERLERVHQALELVRLPDIGDRAVDQLSGGQSQRVALARALVSRPGVLLLDEPLAALDLKLRKAMQLELRRIHDALGTTFLYVTHDQEEALMMSDRIVLMDAGRIVQHGSPREIYDEPASVFASQFIGEANLLRGIVRRKDANGTVVDVDGLEIQGPPSELPTGQAVVVSIRPEAVGVHRSSSSPPVSNRLKGEVSQSIFLGPLIRALVHVTPSVVVSVAASRERADALVEGSPVELTFSTKAVRLLTEE